MPGFDTLPLSAAVSRRRMLQAAGAAGLGALALGTGGLHPPAAEAARTIQFSSHTWSVKTSRGRVGPGPNYFSDSTSNVWVDAQGRLHLKITLARKRWTCAEVVSVASFGYGSYRFFLDSPAGDIDPNAVLGLFTWSDAPAYNHHEIDIEMARWGVPTNDNTQYVVQPWDAAGHMVRFSMEPGLSPSTHSFDWRAPEVRFQSVRGLTLPAAPGDVLREWTFNGAVPVPGGENARMNLWLFQGAAPQSKQPVEVVVNRFEFVPG